MRRLLLASTLALALAALAGARSTSSAAAAATKPPAAHRAAARSVHVAADAPFWAARPNARAFTEIQKQRLARARAAIDRVVAVKGKRTIANTLRPYDDAILQLDATSAQSSLISEVHPDSSLRTAAEKATQAASAFATELSLNRKVYDALSAIDTTGADAETRYYVWRTLRDFRLAGVDKD